MSSWGGGIFLPLKLSTFFTVGGGGTCFMVVRGDRRPWPYSKNSQFILITIPAGDLVNPIYGHSENGHNFGKYLNWNED
jgi:hypothetical protein